jgi:hypothetical protein
MPFWFALISPRAQKATSSPVNLQVGKGGLPPRERRRRDWLPRLSSYSPTDQD